MTEQEKLDEFIDKTEKAREHHRYMTKMYMHSDEELYGYYSRLYKDDDLLITWLKELKARRRLQPCEECKGRGVALDLIKKAGAERPVKLGMEVEQWEREEKTNC